jgi:hypothetical protein
MVRSHFDEVRRAALPVALVALTSLSAAAAEAAAASAPLTHVRSTDPLIAALIVRAGEESATFRGLLKSLQASDGIVYVERGTCGHGVRACLAMWMLASGSHRFLRVLIYPHHDVTDVEVMGSIGHELQHAVEALTEPAVTDGTKLYRLPTPRRSTTICSRPPRPLKWATR